MKLALFLLMLLTALFPAAAARADDSLAVDASPTPRSQATAKPASRKPTPAEEEFTFDLSYAQTSSVWSTVSAIRQAEGNLSAINNVLNSSYGTPQEAFSNVTAEYSRPVSKGSPDYLYFGAGAEALGFGLVQNPVVPELHVNAEAVGLFGGGYSFLASDSGPRFRLGGVWGFGREKRIDATSTDLIESIPIRTGSLSIYGFDFAVSQRFALSRDTALAVSGSTKETMFVSTTPGQASSAVPDQSPTTITHHWKAIGEADRAVELPALGRTWVAVEGLAGPQPVPTDMLPRIWDYAHQLYPTPELGAMFGEGLALRKPLSQSSSIGAHAGYYGGYVGGDLSLQVAGIKLAAASYGLEDSPAYHVMGERIWQASLSFTF